MISYVNTVFVNNAANVEVVEMNTIKDGFDSAETAKDNCAGKFFIHTSDDNSKVKIGLGKDEAIRTVGKYAGKYMPVIKWSNWIDKNAIKSFHTEDAIKDTEDVVTINFDNLNGDVLNGFKTGKQRIVVRLTFKDLPTRFRKWTESYEYIPKVDDTKETIAAGIAKVINDQYKRARVIASVTKKDADEKKEAQGNTILKLEAMPYDDDNSNDTINVANKVRFTANIYYTDPQAAGFASKNKYFPTGVEIKKKEGTVSPNAGKRVRDREAQAMGYEGILNRGCCTWPIIKPQMVTDITKNYNSITIEFENMYRAADDIQRHTKQTVEIYTVNDNATLLTKIKEALGIA